MAAAVQEGKGFFFHSHLENVKKTVFLCLKKIHCDPTAACLRRDEGLVSAWPFVYFWRGRSERLHTWLLISPHVHVWRGGWRMVPHTTVRHDWMFFYVLLILKTEDVCDQHEGRFHQNLVCFLSRPHLPPHSYSSADEWSSHVIKNATFCLSIPHMQRTRGQQHETCLYISAAAQISACQTSLPDVHTHLFQSECTPNQRLHRSLWICEWRLGGKSNILWKLKEASSVAQVASEAHMKAKISKVVSVWLSANSAACVFVLFSAQTQKNDVHIHAANLFYLWALITHIRGCRHVSCLLLIKSQTNLATTACIESI